MYTAYLIPPTAFAVGIVRTALAVFYIAKHYFNECALPENSGDSALGSAGRAAGQMQSMRAERGASWWKRGAASVARTGGGVLGGAAELAGGTRLTPRAQETQYRKEWQNEFFRGVSEIFYVGALYHTYNDLYGSEEVSWLGIGELADLWDKETQDTRPWHCL